MAAANPVVSTVVKRSRETSLELKRVFGEERVEHWEAVKKIVQEKIAPLYGDQASFLKKVETDEDFRCRLLQTDDQPAGVVIYSAKLTDIHGKNDCCLIESFYADDLDASSGPRNMSQCLLDHVLEKAQELKTRALCIKVMKQAGQALKFFQEQHFTILRERETYQWLCRTIEDQTSHSKPETNGSIAHPPVPAAAASTANVDRDPPAPKRPRREEPPAPAAFASPAPSSSSYMPTIVDGFPILQSSKKLAENRLRLQSQQRIDECPIMKKYFEMIRSGTKTIEGRICSYPFTNWQAGSFVKFKNGSESVLCEIVRIVRHDSFATMLRVEGFKSCLPDVYTLEAAIEVYRKIPGYAVKEQRNGVLAIQIKVVHL